jgi:hypothetical protein
LHGLLAAGSLAFVPLGVPIKAVHVTELRAALDAARAPLGLPAMTYANTLVIGISPVRAADFAELRTGTK